MAQFPGSTTSSTTSTSSTSSTRDVVRAVAILREVFYWIDRTIIDGILHLVAWITRGFSALDGPSICTSWTAW